MPARPFQVPDRAGGQPAVDHAVVAAQRLRRIRHATAGQIAGRRHHDPPPEADASDDQRGIRELADAHCEVDPFLHQIGEAVGEHEVDREVGVALQEARQARQDVQAPHHLGRAEPQRPGGAPLAPANARLRLGHRFQRAQPPLVEGTPSSVSVSRRVLRWNSRQPRCSSSSATCRETVGCEEFCSRATAVKEPASTLRTKVRSRVSRSDIHSFFG